MKLLKTLSFVALPVAGLALFFPSYVSTALGYVGAAAQRQVPITFELDRAANLIDGIAPQVEVCKRQVAEAEVALEQLESDVHQLVDKVETGKRKLLADREWLAPPPAGGGAEPAMLVALQPAGRERVALNLQRGLEALRSQSALLQSKQQLLERQRKAVDVARERLQAVRAEQARLTDLVASLRLQQQQVETLAAQAPNVTIDTSALSAAKDTLADIRQRIEVAQRMLQNDMVFAGAPGDPPLAVDVVLADIDQFFAGAAPSAR